MATKKITRVEGKKVQGKKMGVVVYCRVGTNDQYDKREYRSLVVQA